VSIFLSFILSFIALFLTVAGTKTRMRAKEKRQGRAVPGVKT